MSNILYCCTSTAFFGYILAGNLAGPSGYDLIRELIQTETLAQLGVIFIVFVLGLEFSLDKMRAMWRLALGGALLILFATVVIFTLVGAVIGANMSEAVFVGACVSLSSTAVVVKCVKSDELEQMYGLLVMQDVLLGIMLVSWSLMAILCTTCTCQINQNQVFITSTSLFH
jgi:Kef-type K+ transport system membrane component KefB